MVSYDIQGSALILEKADMLKNDQHTDYQIPCFLDYSPLVRVPQALQALRLHLMVDYQLPTI